MIVFLLVTPLLELGHDSLRPFIIYFFGCILGAILSGIVAPNVYLVGASGGCYSLVLAHIANIIINGDIMDKKTMVLRILVLTPMLSGCLWDAYLAFQRWTNRDDYMGGGGVSYAAHISGGFTGLFLGTVALRNYDLKKWEKFVMFGFVVVYLAGFTAVAVLGVMGVEMK